MKNTHKLSVHSELVGLPSDSNQSMPPPQPAFSSTHDQCVKIVRRHHLTLRWGLTLPPLGRDINKPEGQKHHYPRSSLPARVSSTGSGLFWPGLGSSQEETARLSGTEPGRENNNTKSRLLSDDQNTHKTNVSPALSFCNAPFFPPLVRSLGQK